LIDSRLLSFRRSSGDWSVAGGPWARFGKPQRRHVVWPISAARSSAKDPQGAQGSLAAGGAGPGMARAAALSGSRRLAARGGLFGSLSRRAKGAGAAPRDRDAE
jgi:hypothetical protein